MIPQLVQEVVFDPEQSTIAVTLASDAVLGFIQVECIRESESHNWQAADVE